MSLVRMQCAVVLYIGAVSDKNAARIAAHNGVVPDADVLSERHITHDMRTGRKIGLFLKNCLLSERFTVIYIIAYLIEK